MILPFEVDTLLSIFLRDGQEVFGKFVKLNNGFIKLKQIAFVMELQQTVEIGGVPKKVLLGGTESENLEDEIFIPEDKVLYIRSVVIGSELYEIYVQATAKEGKPIEYKS